jgi:hypothetical protein
VTAPTLAVRMRHCHKEKRHREDSNTRFKRWVTLVKR